MNRQQAIAASKNLRKGNVVVRLLPADPDNGIDAPYWEREIFASISAAKREMRSLGRGVALRVGESLPEAK